MHKDDTLKHWFYFKKYPNEQFLHWPVAWITVWQLFILSGGTQLFKLFKRKPILQLMQVKEKMLTASQSFGRAEQDPLMLLK